MKKNLLFGMFAAAGMLLATSCSNDELDAGLSGDEATVSFSIGVEGEALSRAISDGKTADMLVYQVFDEKGNTVGSLQKVVETNVSFPHTVTLTLAKGQTYKIAFWAQNSKCSAYSTENFPQVAVAYTDAEGKPCANNDEERDAFFKTIDFTVANNSASTQKENVVLKRPFAQINVGVYKEDWDAAVASGIVIENSDVTLSNVATSINLIDGSVAGSEEVTYSLAQIPTEQLDVDLEGYEEKEGDFHYLSMSYLLVDDATVGGANRTTINSVEFNFYPSDGNVVNFSQGLDNIPVQRNYRTNIVGKILTGDIDFVIQIDNKYENDINLEKTISAETTQEDLNDILSKGGVVVVSQAPTATGGKISMDGLTLADDLYLIVDEKATVNALALGGNNAAEADKPNVTVEFKGNYPETITFAKGTENVILKGNPNSEKVYGSNLELDGVRNVTISGIKSGYNTTDYNKYAIDVSGDDAENIIIENCVSAANLGQRFINIQKAKNVIIRNNTITCQDGTKNDNTHASQRPIEVANTQDVLIQGNHIINSMNKNGMWINACNKVVITENTIKNANTDGIKVDSSYDVTITNNEVEAKESGIRIDQLAQPKATFVITGNTVITKLGQSADGGELYYGIVIGQTNKGVTVDATLDIKNNIAKSIAGNNYFYLGDIVKPVTGSDYEAPFAFDNGVTVYADGSYGCDTNDQLAAAVKLNNTETPLNIKLGEGTYAIPSDAVNKTLTFIGTGDAAATIIECSADDQANLKQSKAVFENITIKSDNVTYRGFIHVSKATFKNCIIDNCLTLYNDGAEPLEFLNCTFNATGDNYNLWTWGSNVTFTDCRFNCDGKGVLVYGATSKSTVTFNNCTFTDNDGIDGKAAIETGDDYTVVYNININKCTVNGFDVTTPKKELGGTDLGTNVWGNKDRIPADRLNVFIDGTEVY